MAGSTTRDTSAATAAAVFSARVRRIEKAAAYLRSEGYTVTAPTSDQHWARKVFNWQCSPECPATNMAPCAKTPDGAEFPATATHHD